MPLFRTLPFTPAARFVPSAPLAVAPASNADYQNGRTTGRAAADVVVLREQTLYPPDWLKGTSADFQRGYATGLTEGHAKLWPGPNGWQIWPIDPKFVPSYAAAYKAMSQVLSSPTGSRGYESIDPAEIRSKSRYYKDGFWQALVNHGFQLRGHAGRFYFQPAGMAMDKHTWQVLDQGALGY